MSRRRPQRSCKGKRRYESEGDALGMATIRTRHRGAPALRCYPCRHCKGWHLTSKVDMEDKL
jgi:hypothetical protein